uniref:Lipocalin/cytosolic fatty-acid binding domain-containing protein n=1 Tax=Timema genevievae TaxID=629358 RepID=A0A7R9JTT8_TIMGE|nr:unnamed protein product [Timema genevievae]
MENILLVFVAALFLSSVAAHGSKCHRPMGKSPFDQEKFAGDWYVVARASTYPMMGEDTICTKINYQSEPVGNVTRTNLKITITNKDGSDAVIDTKGQSIYPGHNAVTQVAWKGPKDDVWKGVAHKSIMATDYENFAITYFCKERYDEKTDDFGKITVVDLWGRRPSLDESLVDTIKSIMTSFDFDTATIVDVNNSGCEK